MFEVGFSEVLLICVIALLVLGPQKLPKVAQQVGRWMGRARTMARQFRDQLEEEVQLEELKSTAAANKSPDSNDDANKIVPPVVAAATNDVSLEAPGAEPPSSTLTTGIPPEDDFAHHDNAPAGEPAKG
jgi:sec-independent protein translocase protein TatB